MRRAPIVLAATVGGVAGVLSFHTTPAQLVLGAPTSVTAPTTPPTSDAASGPPPSVPTTAAPATAPPTTAAPATTAAPTTAAPLTTTAPATTAPATTAPATTAAPTTAAPTTATPTTAAPTTAAPTTATPTTNTAVGVVVDYHYGILSVSATVSGSKLANVTIASLDDGGNFRSQSIDQQSIPILEQQALQAQSANIQGVSGASYTSAGFQQSLQSALTKLGF